MERNLYEENKTIIKFYQYNLFSDKEVADILSNAYIVAQSGIKEDISNKVIINREIRNSFRMSLRKKYQPITEAIKVYSHAYLNIERSATNGIFLQVLNNLVNFLNIYNIAINEDMIEDLRKEENFNTLVIILSSRRNSNQIKEVALMNDRNVKEMLKINTVVKKENVKEKLVVSYSSTLPNIKWNYVEKKHTYKHTLNIYEMLKEYSKESIDKAVSLLDENDKQYLNYRWNGDYTSNTIGPLWKDEYSMVFSDIVYKKLKNIITSFYLEYRSRESIYTILKIYPKETIDEVIMNLSTYDKELLNKVYNTSNENNYILSEEEASYFDTVLLVNISKKVRNLKNLKRIYKQDTVLDIYMKNMYKITKLSSYTKELLEYMKTDEYMLLRLYLSLEESIIYIMSMGLIQSRHYRSFTIGRVLGMEPLEVDKCLGNSIDILSSKEIKLSRIKRG